MIKSLSINNYALIQDLEMLPSPNLNIITGETGAGKSIMLGAVGLLLGNRANTKALFSENEKCIVEGIFDIKNYKLNVLFEKNDLDFDDECIIRREISPNGKSRGFINDTPVTLDKMKSLGEYLMDIHSQHESLDLGNNNYQQKILDYFAGNSQLLNAYQEDFKKYQSTVTKFNELTKKANASAADHDYRSFLLDELEKANLKIGEQQELESELQVLEHSEEIKIYLSQIIQLLSDSELAAANQIKSALSPLASIKKYSNNLNQLFERLNSTSIELKDITDEVEREQELVELNPERIQFIKDRIDLIYRLEQKHQVTSVDKLISIRDELSEDLLSVLNLDSELKKTKEALDASKSAIQKSGSILSKARISASEKFSKAIESIIHKLGIENGKVNFSVTSSEPNPNGIDQVEMLFSANKGVSPAPLKQVASGGEFSRLIFAVKYLIADKTALPTIIFDEIDTGVSGEVALQMIRMMKEMSKNHQVVSISHLPQFAAGGDSHYFVFKDHSQEKSVSKIKKLNNEERISEIAKMIGGNNPGTHAIISAKELLNQ